MTYSMQIGKYKLIFSDTHFKDFRKKPTISVYDADENSETKIASFNSQEVFEWFIKEVAEQTEPSGKRGEMMSQKEFDEMVHRVVSGQIEPSTDCGWK